MTTISIAMATYNGARYLREQLDSIALQTRLPDELVATDDCSADSSIAILEDFARTAPFKVKIVRSGESLGFNKNFERALLLCSGDYIFISDQDDKWLPSKIHRMIDVMERAHTVAAICDQFIGDEALQRTEQTFFAWLTARGFAKESAVAGCASAFRRDFLTATLPIPAVAARLGYDRWISDLAHELGARTVVLEPLQIYRRHESNATRLVRARAPMISLPTGNEEREWADEAALYGERINRLQRIALGVPDLQPRARSLISTAEAKVAALLRRTTLLTIPRWRRATRIGTMLVRGDYRHFRGAMSAVKDLVR